MILFLNDFVLASIAFVSILQFDFVVLLFIFSDVSWVNVNTRILFTPGLFNWVYAHLVATSQYLGGDITS